MNGKILGFLAVGLTVGSLLSEMAPAQVVTIDPNNFASGQVITAPGVTLETETFVQAGTYLYGGPAYVPTFFGPVYSDNIAASCTAAGGTQCPAIGTNVFAPTPTGALPLPGGENFGPGGFWGNPTYDVSALDCSQNCLLNEDAQGAIVMRLDFAMPVDFVSVLGFSNGGNPTEITAFDAAGNLLGSSDTAGIGSGYGWGDSTLTTSTSDISTVLIGGSDSYRAINEIEYASAPTAAPEIDPNTAASGLTMLLGGLLVLRGRRATASAADSFRRFLT